jgi:hypothetical protein
MYLASSHERMLYFREKLLSSNYSFNLYPKLMAYYTFWGVYLYKTALKQYRSGKQPNPNRNFNDSFSSHVDLNTFFRKVSSSRFLKCTDTVTSGNGALSLRTNLQTVRIQQIRTKPNESSFLSNWQDIRKNSLSKFRMLYVTNNTVHWETGINLHGKHTSVIYESSDTHNEF